MKGIQTLSLPKQNKAGKKPATPEKFRLDLGSLKRDLEKAARGSQRRDRSPPAPPAPPRPLCGAPLPPGPAAGWGSSAFLPLSVPIPPARVRFSLPRSPGAPSRVALWFVAPREGIQPGKKLRPFPHRPLPLLKTPAPLGRSPRSAPSQAFYFFDFKTVLAARSGPFPAPPEFFSFPFPWI